MSNTQATTESVNVCEPPNKRQRVDEGEAQTTTTTTATTSTAPPVDKFGRLAEWCATIPAPTPSPPVLYLGIDPGPVNCGWAVVHGGTGQLCASGVFSCVANKEAIGTAPYAFILLKLHAALKNNQFWAQHIADPVLRAACLADKIELKVSIERQALHDNSPGHISRSCVLIEQVFYYHYAQRSATIHPQTYKRYFKIESSDNKQSKEKAVSRFWDLVESGYYTASEEVIARLKSESTPHEIEAALMAMYSRDMRERPTLDMEVVFETIAGNKENKKNKK